MCIKHLWGEGRKEECSPESHYASNHQTQPVKEKLVWLPVDRENKDEGSVGDACYEWWLIGDRRRLEDGKYRHLKRGGNRAHLSPWIPWMLKATCPWRVQKFECQKEKSPLLADVSESGGDPKTPIQLLFSFLHCQPSHAFALSVI